MSRGSRAVGAGVRAEVFSRMEARTWLARSGGLSRPIPPQGPDRWTTPSLCAGRGQNHGASERGGAGLAQAFCDAGTLPFRGRFAELDDPQLVHELTPQLRTAVGQQFLSDPPPLVRPPGAQ